MERTDTKENNSICFLRADIYIHFSDNYKLHPPSFGLFVQLLGLIPVNFLTNLDLDLDAITQVVNFMFRAVNGLSLIRFFDHEF